MKEIESNRPELKENTTAQDATAKDAMSGEMVEQTHAMCLQQANETIMMMMTNETHKTVLMLMNYIHEHNS